MANLKTITKGTTRVKNTGATLSGKLPTIHSLSQYPQVSEILVIGCGGTGGYVVSHLSRLVSVVNETRKNNDRYYSTELKLYLADGDIVENKNLTRQHFIHNDINRNKAEVLGERYSAAFGIQIGVITKDLEKVDDLKFLSSNMSGSVVVIGCVDNNASRKMIREWFLGTKDGSPDNMVPQNNWGARFWIDSGNEEKHGQVVCGYIPSLRGYYGTNRLNPHTATKPSSGEFSLPCATEMYPNLLDNSDQFNSQVSCADGAISAPQNMQTNVTAATLVMNFVNKIIANEPLKSHCVEFSINNIFTTKLNTKENLAVVNKKRRRSWEQ